jgi:hypothetical protein
LEKDAETFRSFFSKVPFIYLFFEIFDFMTCNDGKQKHGMEKGVNKICWMKGREITIKFAKGGRKAESKI